MLLLIDEIVEGEFAASNLFGCFRVKGSKPAAWQATWSGKFKLDELTRHAIQRRWVGCRAWHDQFGVVDDQISLWSKSADRLRFVGLLSKNVPESLVSPDHIARCNIHRNDEDAFEWPYTRGKVNDSICDNRAAAHWPNGDETPVTEQPPFARNRLMPPEQFAGRELDAVQATVIGSKTNGLFPNSRSKTHWTVCVVHP